MKKNIQKFASVVITVIYLFSTIQMSAITTYSLFKVSWSDGVHYEVDGKHIYIEPDKTFLIQGAHDVTRIIPSSSEKGFSYEPVKPQKKYHFKANKNLYRNVIQSSFFLISPTRKDFSLGTGKITLDLTPSVFPPSEMGALTFLNHVHVRPREKVIDIGTGSGILAIAAAQKGGQVWATDINEDAVTLAQHNASLNNVSITTATGNYFAGINQKFDVVIANLPNEIIPPDYSKNIGEHLTKTISVGDGGNGVMMDFLQILPKYLHEHSRVYLAAYGATDYKTVLSAFTDGFDAQLLQVKPVAVKDYVYGHLDYFKKLSDEGTIILFKEDDAWKTIIFYFQLQLKKV